MPVLIAPLFAVAAAASAPPSTHLIVENCQVGDVYAFSAAECELSFENSGDKPIRVHDFTAASEGDRVTPADFVVAPRAHAYAKATINAGNGHGGVHHVFHFSTDESQQALGSADVFVFVMSALENVKPELDFETVDISQPPSEKSIDLVSPDFPDFRIPKVLQAPDWLSANLDATGHKLSASVRPSADWGLHADFIKLATNSKEQPQVWVSAKADVRGEV